MGLMCYEASLYHWNSQSEKKRNGFKRECYI